VRDHRNGVGTWVASEDSRQKDSGSGCFALLMVPIGQGGIAVKAAFGAQNRRDLDSDPALPKAYLTWRAKETLETAVGWQGSRRQGE
jgi:hypothetical protein